MELTADEKERILNEVAALAKAGGLRFVTVQEDLGADADEQQSEEDSD